MMKSIKMSLTKKGQKESKLGHDEIQLIESPLHKIIKKVPYDDVCYSDVHHYIWLARSNNKLFFIHEEAFEREILHGNYEIKNGNTPFESIDIKNLNEQISKLEYEQKNLVQNREHLVEELEKL